MKARCPLLLVVSFLIALAFFPAVVKSNNIFDIPNHGGGDTHPSIALQEVTIETDVKNNKQGPEAAGGITRNISFPYSFGLISTPREPNQEEYEGLYIETEKYLNDAFRAAYPDTFSSATITNACPNYDPNGAIYQVVVDFAADIVFTAADNDNTDPTPIPDSDQLFALMESTDQITLYGTQYVVNASPPTSVFKEVVSLVIEAGTVCTQSLPVTTGSLVPTGDTVNVEFAYSFGLSTLIREPNQEEYNGLYIETAKYLNDALGAAYPDTFSSATIANACPNYDPNGAVYQVVVDFAADIVFTASDNNDNTDPTTIPDSDQLFALMESTEQVTLYGTQYVVNASPPTSVLKEVVSLAIEAGTVCTQSLPVTTGSVGPTAPATSPSTLAPSETASPNDEAVENFVRSISFAYSFGFSSTIREPNQEEYEGLYIETEKFFNDTFGTAYMDTFSNVTITNACPNYDSNGAEYQLVVDFAADIAFTAAANNDKTVAPPIPDSDQMFALMESTVQLMAYGYQYLVNVSPPTSIFKEVGFLSIEAGNVCTQSLPATAGSLVPTPHVTSSQISTMEAAAPTTSPSMLASNATASPTRGIMDDYAPAAQMTSSPTTASTTAAPAHNSTLALAETASPTTAATTTTPPITTAENNQTKAPSTPTNSTDKTAVSSALILPLMDPTLEGFVTLACFLLFEFVL